MPPARRGFFGSAAAALAVVALVGACGSSDEAVTAGSPGGGRNEQPPSLTIENFRFQPDPLVVPAGTRVTVTNRDDAAHTVTAEDKSFDTGDVAPGAQAEIVLSKPGEVAYMCSIHNYMRGVIRVRD